MGEKRYTIGQMAALCNVSAKQLRYYDNNHILSPALRDPATGYRYYAESQIEEILMIQEMRALGLSLKNAGELLGRRNLVSLREELERSLARIRSELRSTQRRYDRTVELLLRTTHAIEQAHRDQEIRVIDVAPMTVAYTRYVSPWNAKKLFISRRAELYKVIDQNRLHMTGANMAIFHSGYKKQFSDEPENSSGDLEVCIRVVDLRANCACCRTIPALRAVTAIHTGSYADMKPRYEDMENWAAANGLELSGVSIEEYLAGASMTQHKENYVTRLYLPLAGYNVE